MESTHGLSSEHTQLIGIVRGVRNRYRAKKALRGAAIATGAGWLVLLAAVYAMSAFKYSDNAVLAARAVSGAAIVALIVWFIVRPLLPRLDDEQVALYLEEHEQSLQATVITAVEIHHERASVPRSPMLVDRLVHSAVERVHRTNDGRAVDAGELRTNIGIFAAVALTTIVLTLFGPAVLRTGVKLVATPWAAAPASVFSIAVEPGNATVAKGGDELIQARLRGFQSERVELLVRSADSANWTRVPMTADSTGEYAFRLFDIGSKTEYAVEANGVRSTTYTLDVSNLPYVRNIDLQYRFPAYTQMNPQDVDSTGDIAALKGTMVRIRIAPTVATSGGRVVTDAGDTLTLVPTSSGQLMAVLRVDKPGFYKVELQGPQGRYVTGSLDYTIDVLPDRAPTVHFTKPGRDTRVLSVDEVYTEAQAEDDYGVAKLDLVYSVNGQPERTMPLHDGTRALKEISAGYTFMLEGLKVEPGDVVSYYARATDNNAVSGAQTASTDMYFLQVRPYENEYRQQQGGGGGGGGGQQNDAGQLSQREREIIAATFKTARDSAQTDKKAFEEDLATIRLSQQRLREQTTQLVDRLNQRGIASSDTAWKRIAEILPKATAAMDTAERELTDDSPTAARAPEQRALAQLQRAEAAFREIQVSMGQQGGGGGGNRTNAEDLADIFELQKDKLRNQYETLQRGQQQNQQQQQTDNQVDETLEKLRRLAARQQQENERARAKQDSLARMGQSGASAGQSQRDLAQQAEAEARTLERLARDQQNQALADAARRLRDAASQMRRAAANGEKNGASDASQALQNLQDARRLLDQEKNGRSSRDLSDAMRQAQQLADQEKKIQSDVQQLNAQAAASANGATSQQQQQQQQIRQSIAQQKGAMADEVKDLKTKLDRMALDSKRDQKDMSRALEGAADTLRGRKVEEKLRYTQQQMRNAPPDWLNSFEQQIGSDIADLGQRLQQAQNAAQSGNNQRQQAQAADQARNLVRGLESLDERMRQGTEQDGRLADSATRRAGDSGSRQGQQQQQQSQSGQKQAQRNQQGQQQSQKGQQGQQGQQRQQGQQGAQGQQRQGQGQQRGQQANTQQGGGGQRGVTRLTPEDARQFSREAQQRLADAEALRQRLAKQGLPTAELDRAIENLRQLANPQTLEDTHTAMELRAKTVEGFKDFEFSLRRKLAETDSTHVLLERSGDVPPAYKANVEEYYRAIAKGKKP